MVREVQLGDARADLAVGTIMPSFMGGEDCHLGDGQWQPDPVLPV